MPVVRQAAVAARIALDLGPFLRGPSDLESCRAHLADAHATRDRAFLALLERSVFGHARSPYRALLEHAGVTLPDIRTMVTTAGVDHALARLYDAGIRLTLDEFKARRPIVRGSFCVAPAEHDFDNPFVSSALVTSSGGSTGRPTRVAASLDLVAHDSCHDAVVLHGIGAFGRPAALWRPVPPGSAGLRGALRLARIGMPPVRWFSQTPVSLWENPKHAAFTRLVIAAARLHGRRLPMPEHVPLSEATTVVEWLAGCVRRGQPAFLDTTGSAAVRIAATALERGVDIAGTVVRVGGEPHTAARAALFEAARIRPIVHYAMSEVGRIGTACAHSAYTDEVHVAHEKVALFSRSTTLLTGEAVAGLVVTTLLPMAPKVLLNVAVGDSGTLVARPCPGESGGPVPHLRAIRSDDKLTLEGMHFPGADVIRLVEDVLPARFGGTPTDYQLVETRRGTLERLTVVVSPRVPRVDPDHVRHSVIDALGRGRDANRMMADYWANAGVVDVVRREPEATVAGKVPALRRDGGDRS
jgi:hypothetical protein